MCLFYAFKNDTQRKSPWVLSDATGVRGPEKVQNACRELGWGGVGAQAEPDASPDSLCECRGTLGKLLSSSVPPCPYLEDSTYLKCSLEGTSQATQGHQPVPFLPLARSTLLGLLSREWGARLAEL